MALRSAAASRNQRGHLCRLLRQHDPPASDQGEERGAQREDEGQAQQDQTRHARLEHAHDAHGEERHRGRQVDLDPVLGGESAHVVADAVVRVHERLVLARIQVGRPHRRDAGANRADRGRLDRERGGVGIELPRARRLGHLVQFAPKPVQHLPLLRGDGLKLDRDAVVARLAGKRERDRRAVFLAGRVRLLEECLDVRSGRTLLLDGDRGSDRRAETLAGGDALLESGLPGRERIADRLGRPLELRRVVVGDHAGVEEDVHAPRLDHEQDAHDHAHDRPDLEVTLAVAERQSQLAAADHQIDGGQKRHGQERDDPDHQPVARRQEVPGHQEGDDRLVHETCEHQSREHLLEPRRELRRTLRGRVRCHVTLPPVKVCERISPVLAAWGGL